MTRRGRRLVMVAAALGVVGAAVGLALYALSDNISLFLSPSELVAKNLELGSRLRIGGLVALGSVVRSEDKVDFAVTDGAKTVKVDCAGDCLANFPDLFREGQGVIAEGVLAAPDRLRSDRILAKHDERYMPREVVDSLKKQGRWQEGATARAGTVAGQAGEPK
jgi:cytochrome c-type biogenesis protein CcmE